ncbi:MAG: metallophosphoesterase [Lachnospiraceae bacterium]|nr:metallophosphoesterase [Lachnospiraceae bacterium]
MAVSVFRPVLDDTQRMIVIGDLNGNDEAFTRLLAKIGYTRKDTLILLGDLIEQGPDSLRTLRHVMELARVNPVYSVLGERDTICKELLRNDRNEELLRHILSKKSGLIWDMCKTSGITLRPDTNMLFVKQSLRVLYEREIAYICALPHIIETDRYIFAHAQILPGAPENMKPSEVIRADAFLDKGFSFDRYVVVGHWPVTRYDLTRRETNPIINRTRHIICMNGGISEERDGQLNALVLPKENEDFVIYSEDMLPKGKILNSQMPGEPGHTLTAPNNTVIPLRRTEDFAYCKQDKTDLNFWIPSDFLYEKNGKWYSEDITDYQLPVTYGDIVSIIAKTSRGYYVKREGVTGWYYGMMEPLSKE